MKKQRVLAGTIGALVLGGVLVANSGSGVAPAGAQPGVEPQVVEVHTKILNKLNQILAALTSAAGQNNHTVRWDRNIDVSQSHYVAAYGGAVLDNSTGLVWEQAPDATKRTWFQAREHCLLRNVGGTRGWRLPSVVELVSLIYTQLGPPFVPGDVFTIGGNPGVQSYFYWSATTDAANPANAWYVGFDFGGVFSIGKANTIHAWCVRGDMNADTY